MIISLKVNANDMKSNQQFQIDDDDFQMNMPLKQMPDVGDAQPHQKKPISAWERVRMIPIEGPAPRKARYQVSQLF